MLACLLARMRAYITEPGECSSPLTPDRKLDFVSLFGLLYKGVTSNERHAGTSQRKSVKTVTANAEFALDYFALSSYAVGPGIGATLVTATTVGGIGATDIFAYTRTTSLLF
jgi:hypothetical protein